MSLATARRDIEKRLNSNWATTTIAYDNVDFKPVADTAWIRLTIQEGDTFRTTIGSPGVHRHTGIIIIQIFVPVKEGTQTIRGYADTLAIIYRDAQFNGITCREVDPVNVGEVDGWYQYNINIPYYFDGTY